MDAVSLGAILAMAAVTYASRAGGYWLAGRLRRTPFIVAWLEQLPGAVFAALVAPSVAAAGPAGWVGALVGFALMRWTRRFVIAMLGALAAYVGLAELLAPWDP